MATFRGLFGVTAIDTFGTELLFTTIYAIKGCGDIAEVIREGKDGQIDSPEVLDCLEKELLNVVKNKDREVNLRKLIYNKLGLPENFMHFSMQKDP